MYFKKQELVNGTVFVLRYLKIIKLATMQIHRFSYILIFCFLEFKYLETFNLDETYFRT